MLKGLVDYALDNRFLVLAVAVLLFISGAISFKNHHAVAGAGR
jgi:Cu/Ag efflux pump CusA